MVSKSTVLGAAGEHYAMCQLLRHGLIAALAPVGVPNADIVVTDDIGERMSAIQVKARRDIGSDGGWHMKAKHEGLASPLLYNCFVDFGKDETHQAPQCWLMPSAVVADVIARSHAKWLSTPGAQGQARKDGEFRRMLPDFSKKGIEIGCGPGWMDPFKEAWHLIKGPSPD